MNEWIKGVLVLILYFFLFWSFGNGFSCILFKRKRSLGETIITGFFLYYALFQVVAVPMMFAQRKLSELVAVWGWLALFLSVSSVLFSAKISRIASEAVEKKIESERCAGGENSPWKWFWQLVPVGVTAVNIVVVSLIYSNYWDATYYVGNVSFSVYANSINTINPLTGTLLESFDIKHCLTTYHMHDAVFCRLFGIHPLIETKTIMVVVVTILLNLVYYQCGCFFFEENVRAKGLFMGFTFLINLCTYTAYTSSGFILLRTYEGKAITGAIITVFLLYCFLHLWKEESRYFRWTLFITAWGAVAISSSAWFLVIAAIGVFSLGKIGSSGRVREGLRYGICMLPAAGMFFCYMLNRAGILIVPIR